MGIVAKVVWDGGDRIEVPEELGKPREDQLQGTVREQLVELSGRVCYDSLGVGRTSAEYHKHIQEVGHLSVLEHAFATVQVSETFNPLVFINRPGIWVEANDVANGYRITFNPRSILEWATWTKVPIRLQPAAVYLGDLLHYHASKLYPEIVTPAARPALLENAYPTLGRVICPESDDEKWISMFMGGSRGLSHELVRHGDFTAISQRCIAGDTVITVVNGKNRAMSLSHKNQQPRTIKWLYERMQDPRLRMVVGKLKVRVLDEKTGLFTAAKLKDAVFSGKKACFRVNLRDGYHITCTEDHRLWTRSGWKTLKEAARPQVTDGGVVVWARDACDEIGVNGIQVSGTGLYRDVEWMRVRFERGISDSEIARECGVMPATVKHHRVKMGFKKRILRNFSGSPIRDKEWLKTHYHDLSLTQEEIAKLAGCSVAVVHNWARKHGLQKSRYSFPIGNKPWNKEKSYSQTKPYSPESIERYRVSKTGARNPRWKGGIGSEERRAFHTWKRKHKKEVLERDGYCCRVCGRHSSQVQVNSKHMKKRAIEIHHILPLWNRPDLACDPGNMATVCWECQATKLNMKELQYAPMLLEAIKSPVPCQPSERRRPQAIRKVRVNFKAIESIQYAGVIDTYDLVLEGPNHGFVGNWVVVHNSTRFVEESESEWVDHPLVKEYDKAVAHVSMHDAANFYQEIAEVKKLAQKVYRLVVEKLQPWLIGRGVDKLTARKQARGAARGYLGNALYTEMIFSANVAQWKRMLRLRCSGPADAEIRALFVEALSALKSCRYTRDFDGFSLAESPDKIGQVAIEK